MSRKKILAFAGSNSRQSINKKLVSHATTLLLDSESTIIDLNDFEMPIYGIDKEQANGIPDEAWKFKSLLKEHDGIMISFAEHNGAYSAAFKNIFDWISRMEGKTWEQKPILLLATSPGKRGGSNVLSLAANRFPYDGALVVNTFSLPSFYENFNPDEGITDAEKKRELLEKINALEQILL